MNFLFVCPLFGMRPGKSPEDQIQAAKASFDSKETYVAAIWPVFSQETSVQDVAEKRHLALMQRPVPVD